MNDGCPWCSATEDELIKESDGAVWCPKCQMVIDNYDDEGAYEDEMWESDHDVPFG